MLPLLGVGGMQLYKAEAPGPVKDEKLTPRITETAKSLWVVYMVLTVVGIVALRIVRHELAGCDLPCLLGAVASAASRPTTPASATSIHCPIELVLIVLMVLASLNFARHFVALRRLTLRPTCRTRKRRPSCWCSS